MAKILKEKEIGSRISFVLTEPISGVQGPRRKKAINEDGGDTDSVAKINEMLEMFIGIVDNELGKEIMDDNAVTRIWISIIIYILITANRLYELAVQSKTKVDFVDSVDSSELECFSFSDDFLSKVFDICHHV